MKCYLPSYGFGSSFNLFYKEENIPRIGAVNSEREPIGDLTEIFDSSFHLYSRGIYSHLAVTKELRFPGPQNSMSVTSSHAPLSPETRNLSPCSFVVSLNLTQSYLNSNLYLPSSVVLLYALIISYASSMFH